LGTHKRAKKEKKRRAGWGRPREVSYGKSAWPKLYGWSGLKLSSTMSVYGAPCVTGMKRCERYQMQLILTYPFHSAVLNFGGRASDIGICS
jgi:hypothetical protein